MINHIHTQYLWPTRSSSSGRIIAAKDHASIQINVAEVNDKTGVMTGQNKTYALCGFIRAMVLKFC